MDYNYKCYYASARGAKVSINVTLENEKCFIIAIVIIDVKNNISKINWINKREYIAPEELGKEEYLTTLGDEEDSKILDTALLFASQKGYLSKAIKRINK